MQKAQTGASDATKVRTPNPAAMNGGRVGDRAGVMPGLRDKARRNTREPIGGDVKMSV